MLRLFPLAPFIMKASPGCLLPSFGSGQSPTHLHSKKTNMSVPLWATFLLLLGLHRAGARSRIPPPDQPARVARFVMHQVDWAAMATVSSRPPVVGQPFSNVFSVSDGPPGAGSGVPYMYLTRLELSVQDLQVTPQASLSVSLAQTDYCRQHNLDPQSPLCAHVILTGTVVEVNQTEEVGFAKTSLFSRHPAMSNWPSDHDWFFAKLNVTQVWVLDYFGGAKMVSADEYFQAEPDRKSRPHL